MDGEFISLLTPALSKEQGYQAPELIHPEGTFSAHADIFALGMVRVLGIYARLYAEPIFLRLCWWAFCISTQTFDLTEHAGNHHWIRAICSDERLRSDVRYCGRSNACPPQRLDALR